jgi:glycine/D-amino acid oxidase-like deaminating enzyme/nitrite reductase/ring-hydroxylating ferredoxin subunit
MADASGKLHEGVITSGYAHSFWIDSIPSLKFDSLKQDIETDIVIIGAGISGLTVGYCLSQAGRPVVIVEDGFVGSGETGRTTAHIVNALDDRYSEIEKYHGEDGARLAAESHTAAIDFVESIVLSENIDCDFRRVEGYLFLHETDERKTLEDELEATHRAGINTSLIEEIPGIMNAKGPCLQFPRQAQFHPLKYLHGLARAIINRGGKIFTESHVTDVKKNRVEGSNFSIKANHIVVATNTPINDLVTMHTKQFPYRTYVIAAAVQQGSLQPALWWDTGNQKSKWVTMPYNYVRLQKFNDQFDLLICGGADHKTGQADEENIPEADRFKILEDWAREKFPGIGDILYRWSGQVMEPLDSMGFIGRNPGDKDTYIVTGDSGNGMTHGTIAGRLITDLITGKENPWEKLYSPSRITMKIAGDYLKEVGNMAAQYVDYISAGDMKSAKELQNEEGGVLAVGLKKVAVYKDASGNLNAYSAICPHLGCVLQWNEIERSFDCPCHGSRFTCEGKVINGPASTDLKKIEITEKMKA